MGAREATWHRRLDLFGAILGALALLTLLQHFGLPELRLPPGLVLVWTSLLSTGLFVESLARLLVASSPWSYLARHPLRYLILAMVALELSGVASWSSGEGGTAVSALAGQVYLAVSLAAHLGTWLKALLLANRWLTNLRIPVLLLPPLTFLLVILVGAGALVLPGMQRLPFGFLEAAFTATSAVCVTGLSVIDIGTSLSPVGTFVLALLIQIGGLGTLTIMGLLALWTRGELSLGERVALPELLGGTGLAETRRIVASILRITLAFETVGALLLWTAFRDRVPHPLLYGIFHAVSAFCNAGFSLFPDSLEGFAANVPLLATVMVLIVAGGLGFPVLSNLGSSGVSRAVPWLPSRPLTRTTRFALLSTAILLGVGTLAFLADSWLSGGRRSLLEALFQSVTLRTAGFQVESQLSFGGVATSVGMVLMVIGASPQSTGGGLKTSVAARLLVRLDGGEGPSRASLAWVLGLGYLATGGLAGLLVAVLDGAPPSSALFEAYSALGTVGLSRNLTATLSTPSRLVLMLLMFAGRVLYPTLVALLVRRRGSLPDETPWA